MNVIMSDREQLPQSHSIHALVALGSALLHVHRLSVAASWGHRNWMGFRESRNQQGVAVNAHVNVQVHNVY